MAIPKQEAPKWLVDLGQTLDQLPEELAAVAGEIESVGLAIEELQEKLKDREYDLLTVVSQELDPATNKPRFSNAELRQGEVNRRLRTDEDCRSVRDQLHALRDKQGKLRVEGTKLANKFSGTKARARLLASWMAPE